MTMLTGCLIVAASFGLLLCMMLAVLVGVDYKRHPEAYQDGVGDEDVQIP